MGIILKCFTCQKKFEKRRYQKLIDYRTGKRCKNFCSKSCRKLWLREDNPIPKGSTRSEIFKKELSRLLRKKYRSGEVIRGCIGKPRKESTKKKLSEFWFSKFASPEGKLLKKRLSRQIRRVYANLSEEQKEERREELRRIAKFHWNNPCWIKAWAEKRERKPNGIEIKADNILKKYGFKYVGDFSFWIARKNPDFVNTKNKTVIEIFGRYYHDDEDFIERKAHFEKCGWKCFIFWEDELNKIESVIG
jgi:very-short-patch-repair endonuclease